MSSGISRFENQVHWARFYLSKAGFIDSSRRGVWSLTDKSRGIPSLSPNQAADLFRAVSSQFGKKGHQNTDPNFAVGLKPRRTFEVDASFFKDFEES